MVEQRAQDLPIAEIPQPNQPIRPAARQGMAVRVERHGAHNLAVALEGSQGLAAADIPEADAAIMRTADQQPVVRCECEAFDFTAMPEQGADDLAAAGIPQTDHPIAAARQQRAVGAKGQPGNPGGILMQAVQELATREIPHADGAVAAAAGQALPIGAERQGQELAGMALERVQALAAGCGPRHAPNDRARTWPAAGHPG